MNKHEVSLTTGITSRLPSLKPVGLETEDLQRSLKLHVSLFSHIQIGWNLFLGKMTGGI